MELRPHQEEAVNKMRNGCILWGGVGTGKSLTAVEYYVRKEAPKDVIVITTAKKRDSLDWEREFSVRGIGKSKDASLAGVLTVDSWNNISKYIGKTGCFFIFDEQRLVGTGAWVKSFYKIAKNNNWVVLSATPGDTWLDYAPVFIANGWYKNITAFKLEHVVYEPYVTFPKVRGYLGISKLTRQRQKLLIEMPFVRETLRTFETIHCDFDRALYDEVATKRWDIYQEKPIKNVSGLFSVLKRVSLSDPSRFLAVRRLLEDHPRLIVFYNFDYELEMLRELREDVPLAEWNGHRHMPIPETDRWVYLVQYQSGAEGWNCVSTDAMVFFSLTYSYKLFEQAQGRIDRLNTKYRFLKYYILTSDSPIERSLQRILAEKRSFNELEVAQELGLETDI